MDQWKYELAKSMLEWQVLALHQTMIGKKPYPTAGASLINHKSTRAEGWNKAIEIVAWHFSPMAGEQLFGSKYGHGLVLYGTAWGKDEAYQIREHAGHILNMILKSLRTARERLPKEDSGSADFHASRGAMDCVINHIRTLIKEYGCNHDCSKVYYTSEFDGPPEAYRICAKCKDRLYLCPECEAAECTCVVYKWEPDGDT